MQYEGISALCFSCGRIGHKVEGCLFTTRALEKTNNDGEGNEMHAPHDHSIPSEEAYGPWILVSCKRHASKKGIKTLSNLPKLERFQNFAPAQSAGPSKLQANLCSYNDSDVSLKPKPITLSNASVAKSTCPAKKVVLSNSLPSALTSKNHHNGPKNRQQS